MNLLDIVLEAKNSNASDIHITSESPIQFRIDGIMTGSRLPVLTANELRSILESAVPDRLKEKYSGDTDVDFAITIEGVARLRCNLYHSFGREAAAIRLLPTRVIDKNELNLPEQLVEFSNLTKGLVLITGATGCGKSTTLAALLNEINKNHSKGCAEEFRCFPRFQKLFVRHFGDDCRGWCGFVFHCSNSFQIVPAACAAGGLVFK